MDNKDIHTERYVKIKRILDKIDAYERRPSYDSTTFLNMKLGTEQMIIDSYKDNIITESEYEELIERGRY